MIWLAPFLFLLAGCIGNDTVDVETGPLELHIVPPPIYAPPRRIPSRIPWDYESKTA